jgi:hypothetical protein
MMYPRYKKTSIIDHRVNTVKTYPRYLELDLTIRFDKDVVNQYP